MTTVFQNHQSKLTFRQVSRISILLVFPTLFQFPAICISYITRISVISVIRISNRVISCSVLNVLCSEHFIKKPLEVTCK